MQTLQQHLHDVEDFEQRWRLLTLDPDAQDRLEFSKAAENLHVANLQDVLTRYSRLIVALFAWGMIAPIATGFLAAFGPVVVAQWCIATAREHWLLFCIPAVFVIVGVWANWDLRRDQ